MKSLLLFGSGLSLLAAASVLAQGTFTTSFEEYGDGTTPSLATKDPFYSSWPAPYVVTGSGFPDTAAADGAKSLFTKYTPFAIRAPDGAPIVAFSLVFHGDEGILSASLLYHNAGVSGIWGQRVGDQGVGDFRADLAKIGQWQEIRGTFNSPASFLYLFAFGIRAGEAEAEFFPFTIDRLELITIPEPTTWSLLALGGAFFSFCALRRRTFKHDGPGRAPALHQGSGEAIRMRVQADQALDIIQASVHYMF
jgi:hypothetical protein